VVSIQTLNPRVFSKKNQSSRHIKTNNGEIIPIRLVEWTYAVVEQVLASDIFAAEIDWDEILRRNGGNLI